MIERESWYAHLIWKLLYRKIKTKVRDLDINKNTIHMIASRGVFYNIKWKICEIPPVLNMVLTYDILEKYYILQCLPNLKLNTKVIYIKYETFIVQNTNKFKMVK
jgi:hypothetical protein